MPGSQEAVGVVRADPAALGENFGLGQLEMVCADKHRPKPRQWGFALVALSPCGFLAALPYLIGAAISGIAVRIVVGAAWEVVLAVCPGMLGALLMWRFPVRRTDQLFYYSGGIIQMADGEPEPRVLRWADLVSLSALVYRPNGDDPVIAACTVRDRQGNRVTAGVRLGPVGNLPDGSNGAVLARKADPILNSTVVPAMIRGFEDGQAVSFGSVRINRDGITDAPGKSAPGPLRLAWPDIWKIEIDARLVIRVFHHAGKPKAYSEIDLGESPNAFYAYHIIERAAAQASIPVTYYGEGSSGEGRLPPRLPAPNGRAPAGPG